MMTAMSKLSSIWSLSSIPVTVCAALGLFACTVQNQAAPDAEPPAQPAATAPAQTPPAQTAPAATQPVVIAPGALGPSSGTNGDAACGPRPEDSCVAGQGGQCGDALRRYECTAGKWTCPEGTVPTSTCKCLGKPAPGCTCTDKGLVCNGANVPN